MQKVADYIHDIEDFGDLPPSLLMRLGQILSRRRAVTSRTLDLFLRPQYTSIDLFDCASKLAFYVHYSTLSDMKFNWWLELDTDDYHKILASMPRLTRINLRFTTPMKDQVFHYMMERDMNIKDLHLDGPNLVTDDCWRQLFTKLGHRFLSLKLWNLDSAFDNETAKVMCLQCPNLHRLKLKFLHKLDNQMLAGISTLRSLQHLSLRFMRETEIETEPVLQIVASVGSQLRSLSLEEFEFVDDRLLQHLHEHCHLLTKLRLTLNSTFTDKGLAALFTGWSNQALTYVDLHSLRDVDMTNPAGPEEPIGLASGGFIALMEHSGSKVQHLNIASCRHVSYEAFEQVFAENKLYPKLKYLDISFSTVVDDYLIQCILRCCPALQRLVVFACFKIRDVHIPRGLALIGTVGATIKIDGITQTETI
jgi:DNA repair protein RAD7